MIKLEMLLDEFTLGSYIELQRKYTSVPEFVGKVLDAYRYIKDNELGDLIVDRVEHIDGILTIYFS